MAVIDKIDAKACKKMVTTTPPSAAPAPPPPPPQPYESEELCDPSGLLWTLFVLSTGILVILVIFYNLHV